MKNNICFLLLFLLVGSLLHSQSILSSSYVSSHTGNSVVFGYGYAFDQSNEIGIGIKIHINNTFNPDDQHKIYYRRLYSDNLFQHLGLQMHYNHTILKKLTDLHLFLFYNTQLSYGCSKNLGTGDNYFKFGPLTWWENAIGLGFKAALIKDLSLVEKIGLDTDIIFGKDINGNDSTPTFELGCYLNIGLEYSF